MENCLNRRSTEGLAEMVSAMRDVSDRGEIIPVEQKRKAEMLMNSSLLQKGELVVIRRAIDRDASRIAEISVFSKRMNYREIFRNDMVSFGEIQVC